MAWTAVLFSAIMVALALPNDLSASGFSLIGAVALVPLLLAVYGAKSWRTAARMGALFGAVSTAAANYWLAFFGEFSVWTIGGTVLGYTGYNAILFGYLFHLSRNPRFRTLRIAVLWTGYEYLKSVGFLGYPWGLIAYPATNLLPLAQLAELTGVWGLSFLMAFANTSIAELVFSVGAFDAVGVATPAHDRRSVVQPAVAAVLLFLVAAGFGQYRLTHRVEPQGRISVLLVQQNVNSWTPGRFPEALSQAQNLTREGIKKSGRPDLIIWSETALRRPYVNLDEYYRVNPPGDSFLEFLRETGAPLVTGTPLWVSPDTNDLMNGAVLIFPDGSVGGRYGKQQLVPFAESIPYYENEAVKAFFRNVIGIYGSWVAGEASTVMEVPSAGIVIGTPICFEDAFGWVSRSMVKNGAQVLINLTNNSWSRRASAQTQHYIAARLRAIEVRTPLVRGTNSGLTAVVKGPAG